jgi:hypothetical protein
MIATSTFQENLKLTIEYEPRGEEVCELQLILRNTQKTKVTYVDR